MPEAYVRMYHESEAARDLLGGDQYAPPGTGKPLNERLAANPMGKFWQRRLAMSQWEVIRENFENDHNRSFLMATPWSMQPPQYPMTGRSAYIGNPHDGPQNCQGRIGCADAGARQIYRSA